jgi:hypothetical protein
MGSFGIGSELTLTTTNSFVRPTNLIFSHNDELGEVTHNSPSTLFMIIDTEPIF